MLKEYGAMMSNKFEGKPKVLQTNNRGEKRSHYTHVSLEKQGMFHCFTHP